MAGHPRDEGKEQVWIQNQVRFWLGRQKNIPETPRKVGK